MAGIINRTLLELEVLEGRCAPTAVATGAATKDLTAGAIPNEPISVRTNPAGVSSAVKVAVDVTAPSDPNLGKLSLTPKPEEARRFPAFRRWGPVRDR